VIVRSAEIDDARQIATVHVDAWRAAYRDLLPEAVLRQFAANRERSWREILSGESEASPTLVAVDQAERVAGFCALSTPSRDDDADERTAEIAATYVEPSRWRAGIGSALLEAALGRLSERGYEQVTLWVFGANERARSFYQTFGFEPDGRENRHDWSGGLPEVRLRTRL
jgi:ribosomal protein S18 acetylase RimI-like enzyme